MARLPGIAITIDGNLVPLQEAMKEARTLVKDSAGKIESDLGGALSSGAVASGINRLVGNLGQVSRATSAAGADFKKMGVDLGDLAKMTGLSSQELTKLQGRMLETQATRAARDGLAAIQKQTGLTSLEMVSLRMKMGDAKGAFLDLGKSATSGLSAAASAATSLQAAIAAMGIGYLAKQIFEAGVAVDQLDRTFKVVFGSAGAAAKEMEWLRGSADRLGQNVYVLADSYKTFAAATMSTNLAGKDTREIFEAITMASTALGLSAQDTSRVFRAFQQIINTGKVQGDELNQLFENLPGTLNLFASALGVTTAKFLDMKEKGQVLSDDVMPKIGVRLREVFGQAAVESATSAQAALNKFNEAWMDLKVQIARGGAVDALSEAMRVFASRMKDPDMQEATRSLGASVGSLASNLPGAVSGLTSFVGALDKLAGAYRSIPPEVVGLLLGGGAGARLGGTYGAISGAALGVGAGLAQRSMNSEADAAKLKAYEEKLTELEKRTQELIGGFVAATDGPFALGKINQNVSMEGTVLPPGALEAQFNAANPRKTPYIDPKALEEQKKLLAEARALAIYGREQEYAQVEEQARQYLEKVKGLADGEATVAEWKRAKIKKIDEKYDAEYEKGNKQRLESAAKNDQAMLDATEKLEQESAEKKAKANEDLTKKIMASAMTKKNYELWALDEELKGYKDRYADETLLAEYKARRLADINETALDKMLKSWRDTDKLIEETTANTIKSIQSEFASNLTSFLKGEFNTIDDLWQAVTDSMINIFAQMVAQMVTIWVTSKIAGLFEENPTGITINAGGGAGGAASSVATGLAGKALSYIGEKTGITAAVSGVADSAWASIAGALGLGGGATMTATEAAGILESMGASSAGGDIIAGAVGSDSLVGSAAGDAMLTTAPSAMTTAMVAAAPVLVMEALAALGITKVGPVGALAGILTGSDTLGGGHTPASAMDYLGAQFGYVSRANAIGGEQAGMSALMNNEDLDWLEATAERLGITREAMDALAASIDPALAGLLEARAVVEPLEDSLQTMAGSTLRGSDALEAMRGRLNEWVVSLGLGKLETEALWWTVGELTNGLYDGALTAETFTQGLNDGLTQALDAAEAAGLLTTEQMKRLRLAIESIPVNTEITVSVNEIINSERAAEAIGDSGGGGIVTPDAFTQADSGGGSYYNEEILGGAAHSGGWIPSFHSGGWTDQRREYAPDEFLAWVRPRERVISPENVTELGGPQAVDRLLAGGGNAGPVNLSLTIVTPDGRTLREEVYKDMARGGGPKPNQIRVSV